jgi:beta-mannosidase
MLNFISEFQKTKVNFSMNRLSLNGTWELYQTGQTQAIPAPVPGCVHTALLNNNLLEDPFYRDNELQQMWVGETDWLYKRQFSLIEDWLEHERLILRCYGLDTIATLTLNGVEIAQTDNMFRTWEIDVKPFVKAGANILEVFFAAPATYARRMDEERGEMASWAEPMRINGGGWIRKEPCNFGWDWGPKMVTSGIWREIELIAFDTARLIDVHILQDHTAQGVTLTVNLTAEQTGSAHPLQAEVEVWFAGQKLQTQYTILSEGSGLAQFHIADPHLWWPNGMGAQPLYEVKVHLKHETTFLDQLTKRIGLRTLTLERYPDQWGEAFQFACNGVPYFAKGANWIPASPYPGSVTSETYRQLIEATRAANMNMLRVWGGGYYEDDIFYDLCDEMGITIWQDFMFACGTYPSFDDAFMANVSAEARDNVRRIRHHACLALWCGNNEIEQGLPDSPGWQESMSWADYERLFDHLLHDIVKELDPATAYWPGSPHSPCGDRNQWINPDCGDTHLWFVWHGKEPFEWYRTRVDRFCSEFGFQSFPEPAVIEEFTLPEDRNITSYVMEHHQRSRIGNATIIHYMLDWFRLPTSAEGVWWLSQILQGMAMKYAVEHWRRNMPRTMGTLYWQLNDMWPAPSWSSLDWKLNWKALHYMARRFYAPLLISGLENTENHTIQVHVTSDLAETTAATVRWTITDVQGTVLAQETHPVAVAARANTHVCTINAALYVSTHTTRNLLIWLELLADGEVISENLTLLERPKHMPLPKPDIQVSTQALGQGEFSVTLQADVPVLYVWLSLPQARFSDNFFHLQAGIPKTIHVTSATINGLHIQSLVDTY